MRKTIVSAAAALLISATLSFAHGPKGEKPAGINGGQIVDVDGGHLELVASPTVLKVYVTDLQDKPLATTGLSGRAFIQDGAKQAVLPLVPAELNVLQALLATPLSVDAKVAVSAALTKDGKPVQARFLIK